MKMEEVFQELKNWGEILITTEAGQTYEIHLGDTQFDMSARMIRLKTPEAEHIIAGDSVESITKHYGHPISGQH